MTNNLPAFQRRITDVVAEYNEKIEGAEAAVAAFEGAGAALGTASCIMGTYGREILNTGSVSVRQIKESLRKSAWWNVYDGLNIAHIATAADKRIIEREMENPPEFTLDNVRATFGRYLLNPRENILRGLAEVFCSLDQSYKSHERVKIGVKGLPKRIILSGVSDYGYGWGFDKLKDVINALAAYQGKPLVTHEEMQAILKDEKALVKPWVYQDYRGNDYHAPARGVWLRRFKNGNAHLFFDGLTLVDINNALAEYYGDVLPDDSSEKPTERHESTSVSKDLQYYPTPKAVVERVLSSLCIRSGEKVLEPSCGCGRIMDGLRERGAIVQGFEVSCDRARQAKDKGHSVVCGNFLEQPPEAIYDRVVMNPPFYRKHYAKHVNHALKFLKEGGVLTAILPATARYDHGLLSGRWQDLPVGSFSESGTNVNTTVLTIVK